MIFQPAISMPTQAIESTCVWTPLPLLYLSDLVTCADVVLNLFDWHSIRAFKFSLTREYQRFECFNKFVSVTV